METNFSFLGDMISLSRQTFLFGNPVMTLVEIIFWVNTKQEVKEIMIGLCSYFDMWAGQWTITQICLQQFHLSLKIRSIGEWNRLSSKSINFTNCRNLYLPLKSDTQHEAKILSLQTGFDSLRLICEEKMG